MTLPLPHRQRPLDDAATVATLVHNLSQFDPRVACALPADEINRYLGSANGHGVDPHAADTAVSLHEAWQRHAAGFRGGTSQARYAVTVALQQFGESDEAADADSLGILDRIWTTATRQRAEDVFNQLILKVLIRKTIQCHASSGGHQPDQSSRLYRLLAIAAARHATLLCRHSPSSTPRPSPGPEHEWRIWSRTAQLLLTTPWVPVASGLTCNDVMVLISRYKAIDTYLRLEPVLAVRQYQQWSLPEGPPAQPGFSAQVCVPYTYGEQNVRELSPTARLVMTSTARDLFWPAARQSTAVTARSRQIVLD